MSSVFIQMQIFESTENSVKLQECKVQDMGFGLRELGLGRIQQ